MLPRSQPRERAGTYSIKEDDFAAFLKLMALANARLPMRVLAYCYHRHYGSSGHVWQGRFKAFPIEQDEHLLAVLRYAERNPLRANLLTRAEDWPWSSLAWRVSGGAPTC